MTLLTGSLVDTNSIFSHDSLQNNIPGSAASIGSARTRKSSLRSKQGHFLSPTSQWHVLRWIEFKSLIICPHGRPSRAAVSKHASRSLKEGEGEFPNAFDTSIVENRSLLPTLLRICCIFDYFTVFMYLESKTDVISVTCEGGALTIAHISKIQSTLQF